MRARFIDFPKYSCIIGRIWLTLTKSLESVVFIEKAANFSLKLLISRGLQYNLLIIRYLTIEFYFLSSTKQKHINELAQTETNLKREISQLTVLLNKTLKWFPQIKDMINIERLCLAVGFNKE